MRDNNRSLYSVRACQQNVFLSFGNDNAPKNVRKTVLSLNVDWKFTFAEQCSNLKMIINKENFSVSK